MKLSQHFRLNEFTRSQTAERLSITIKPNEEIIENLTILCVDYLELIRKELGDPVIFISSGYRPLELNKAIGGSLTSAHMDGRAADFVATGVKPYQVCRTIRDLGLNYDQNIHEFGRWTHLGIRFEKPRMSDLTAYKKSGKTLYTPGIHKIKDLI